MAMNHNEHPITVIIGIGLLIALGILPFYCKSFMTWIYIAICCVIVVGLLGLVLHLRHNQKIKQENRAALAENPKRIAIFHRLGDGSDIETTGTLDYPLLRHPKGYDVKWLYDSTREVVFFSTYVNEKEEAVIRQKYDAWLSQQAPEDMAGFEMVMNLSSFEDTVDEELLDGVNLLQIGFKRKTTERWGRIESLLLKLQTFIDSLSPYYIHRQFCLKGILKAGVYVEYEGLTLVSTTRPTPKGMEDATEHLPSGDFKRLNTMLNWMRVDDMVYIESWEDIRL